MSLALVAQVAGDVAVTENLAVGFLDSILQRIVAAVLGLVCFFDCLDWDFGFGLGLRFRYFWFIFFVEYFYCPTKSLDFIVFDYALGASFHVIEDVVLAIS